MIFCSFFFSWFFVFHFTGCIYVLHSTAQLFSHKRKHERRDFETAYRKYREDSNDMDSSLQYRSNLVSENQSFTSSPLSHMSLPISIKTEINDDDFKDESCDSRVPMSEHSLDDSNSDVKSLKSEESDNKELDRMEEEETMVLPQHADRLRGEKLNDSLTLPIPVYTKQEEKQEFAVQGTMSLPTQPKVETGIPAHFKPSLAQGLNVPIPQPNTPLLLSKTAANNTQERKERDESWKNYLIRYWNKIKTHEFVFIFA